MIKKIDRKIDAAKMRKSFAKQQGVSLSSVRVVRVEDNDLYDEFCNATEALDHRITAMECQTAMTHEKSNSYDLIISNSLVFEFNFGYMTIKPNRVGGIELNSIVVYEQFRGQGLGSKMMVLFCDLLAKSIIVLVEDNVEIGTSTLSAALNITSPNGQHQTSPMRQKIDMYSKIGYFVTKFHNPGLIDMELDYKSFLTYCQNQNII